MYGISIVTLVVSFQTQLFQSFFRGAGNGGTRGLATEQATDVKQRAL